MIFHNEIFHNHQQFNSQGNTVPKRKKKLGKQKNKDSNIFPGDKFLCKERTFDNLPPLNPMKPAQKGGYALKNLIFTF